MAWNHYVYEELDDTTWRHSLPKSELHLPDFTALAEDREAALTENEALNTLFSFKGISLSFLNKFWREIRKDELMKGVELVTLTSEGIDGVEVGTTLRLIDSDRRKLRCSNPLTGDFVTVQEDDVALKKRKYWTIDDICTFYIIPQCRLLGRPILAHDETKVGQSFEGRYVVCSRDCEFEQLLLSLRDMVRDEGISTAEASYFWLDFFSTNLYQLKKLDSAETEEQNRVIRHYQASVKKALRLFDARIVYFTDFAKPSVFEDLQCVWELALMCQEDLTFGIFNRSNSAVKFMEVYDSMKPGLLDLLSDFDISLLPSKLPLARTFLLNELTNQDEGFLTVLKALKRKMGRWFLKEVETDVKEFAQTRLDFNGIERYAMMLYKTGDFMRKNGEFAVAKSYLNHALTIYSDLQQYSEELERKKSSKKDVYVTEQVQADRINGGASKVNVFLGLIHLEQGQIEKAKLRFRDAETNAEKAFIQKHAFITDVSEARAKLQMKAGNFKAALDHLTAMFLVLRDEEKFDYRVRFSDVEVEMGKTFLLLGDIEKALKSFNSALTNRLLLLGSQSLKAARVRMEIGSLYFKQANDDKALEYYNLALEVLEANKGTINEETARLWRQIALCYNRKGNDFLDEAIRCYRKSIETFQLATGPATLSLAVTMQYEGLVLKEQGKLEEAEGILLNAIEVLDKELVVRGEVGEDLSKADIQKRDGMLAGFYSNLGQIQEDAKDFFKAKKSYFKSYEITKKLVGAKSAKTVQRKKRWENAEAKSTQQFEDAARENAELND